MTDARRFYTERIPAQFNAALDAQAALGEAGRRVYEGMTAVNATLRIDVRGEGGGAFFLNIRNGRMTAEADAAQAPFLTLVQDLAVQPLGGSEGGHVDAARGLHLVEEAHVEQRLQGAGGEVPADDAQPAHAVGAEERPGLLQADGVDRPDQLLHLAPISSRPAGSAGLSGSVNGPMIL